MSIIPLRENKEQRDVEKVGEITLSKFNVKKVSVNPLECDILLLEHLALSLDINIAGLDENEARTYLQNAREIKKYIGTSYAVKKASEAIYGKDIKVEPWNKHSGVPGTYKIIIEANKKPVTEANLNKTIRLIDYAKRVSTHLSGITINMKSSGLMSNACTTQSSEDVTILPQVIEDINMSLKENIALTFYMIESIVLKPKGA
ncbi:phage tail protein [Sulfurimonas sp.]|uniref:phage tail protein n=1 Tax=Sulfurimonas sp. TaxID=2022749 RepID=UPI0025DE741C|nr:phage tail protein [Sulfurimonas sp.]